MTGPPTCSMTLKKEYPDYLGLDEKIQLISENTFDISEYLVYLNQKDKLKKDFKEKIGTVNYCY